MSWIMVDIEADGPVCGLYSMIEIGAVLVSEDLKNIKSFGSKLAPISDNYVQAALDVTKTSRAETLLYPDPELVMQSFYKWLITYSKDQPRFISDNNGFDWQFVNYYFWKYLNRNPFGHSSTNLGSLYKGLVRDSKLNFKHLRKTKHTHAPIDDCLGNVEALLEMRKMGLSFVL